MTIDLDRLEELARAATPGPYVLGERDGRPVLWAWNDQTLELTIEGKNATYFGALAPSAVLELLARLRAAEGVPPNVRRIQELETRCAQQCDDAVKREAELERLRAIVRDLAACDPRLTYRYRDDEQQRACAFCGAMPDAHHSASCLHRRAVEYKP